MGQAGAVRADDGGRRAEEVDRFIQVQRVGIRDHLQGGEGRREGRIGRMSVSEGVGEGR